MKKILKKIDGWVFGRTGGKIIVGCLALFGAVSLVLAVVRYNRAYEMIKDARWRAEQAAEEWRGHPISRNVVFKDYRQVRGKGYVENLYEGKKTVEGVEWVRPTLEIINEPDSMALYSRYEVGRGSRKGYLDIYSGTVRIPDKFKHAWNFKNGRYAVVCMDNDSLYVIDRNGHIVSERGFRLTPEWRFGFMFNDDLCIMQENDGKFGIVNPKGEWVLMPEYDWIVRNPINGDYKITKDRLFGVKNKNMKEILPVKFTWIDFNEHWNDPYKDAKWFKEVAYWADNDEGMKEYYDKNGKLLKIAKWERRM